MYYNVLQFEIYIKLRRNSSIHDLDFDYQISGSLFS